MPVAGPSAETRPILVLGATGRTGQAIVREALVRGHAVTALVRSRANASALLSGATLRDGDARDTGAVDRALEGCEVVLSALGTRRISLVRQITTLSEATRVLVDAMKRRSVPRLVCITGLGAGDSAGHGGFVYDRLIKPILLRRIYEDKDRQESIIRRSGLDWVIVRPTVLTDGPATGRVRVLTDLTGFHGGKISRADVAAFVVAQIESGAWLHKTPLISEEEN